MHEDLDIIEVGAEKAPPETGMRRLWQLVIYPLLGLVGFNTLLTGFPVPLWYTERLDDPVTVRSISGDALVLADGRRARLQFIKRVPRDDPVFLDALRYGVEIGPGGEVIGLIKVYRNCGHDPYVTRTLRVNLSDLAGVLDPGGIDRTIVHPEEIEALEERYGRHRDRHGLPHFVMSRVLRMRSIYEFHAGRMKGAAPGGS